MSSDVSPQELKALMDSRADFVLIDIREPFEVAICKLDGAVFIPMGQLTLESIDPKANTILYCHRGNRTGYVLEWLRDNGYTNVRHLAGGIKAWAETIDPTMQQY